jgi:hypothetical protein
METLLGIAKNPRYRRTILCPNPRPTMTFASPGSGIPKEIPCNYHGTKVSFRASDVAGCENPAERQESCGLYRTCEFRRRGKAGAD